MIRLLKKYLLPFILIYFLLVALLTVPAVKDWNYRFITSSVNSTYATFLASTFFKFEQQQGSNSIKVIYKNKEALEKIKREAIQKGINTLELGGNYYILNILTVWYIPFCFLIALFSISPAPLKNKLIFIVIGLVLLFLFVQLKVLFIALYYLVNNDPENYQIGAIGKALAHFFRFNVQTGATIFFIIALWVLLFFRDKNWKGQITEFLEKRKSMRNEE